MNKWDVFWQFTKSLAKLSNCQRLQVGCIIITLDLSEVLAIGYNGPASGVPNDSCRLKRGNCGCIHAEANALIKLKARANGLTLITTVCPCEHCAGLIVNSRRIDRIVYGDTYRDSMGLDLLINMKIEVVRASEFKKGM